MHAFLITLEVLPALGVSLASRGRTSWRDVVRILPAAHGSSPQAYRSDPERPQLDLDGIARASRTLAWRAAFSSSSRSDSSANASASVDRSKARHSDAFSERNAELLALSMLRTATALTKTAETKNLAPKGTAAGLVWWPCGRSTWDVSSAVRASPALRIVRVDWRSSRHGKNPLDESLALRHPQLPPGLKRWPADGAHDRAHGRGGSDHEYRLLHRPRARERRARSGRHARRGPALERQRPAERRLPRRGRAAGP